MLVVAVIVTIIVVVALPRKDKGDSTTFATNDSGNGSLNIITISGGSLIGGSKFLITPNPFTGEGNLTVQDGGSDDRNSADGIMRIGEMRDGNFTVTQVEAPAGYARDKLSKIVEVTGSNDSTATFSNIAAGENNETTNAQIRSIVYTAKFECGTIRGDEGPLRPGHYDTDIGIFNKQEFPVRITWTAATNDGGHTNAILRTLEPQSSTGVVCKDLRRTFGNGTFVEGFVLIEVPLDPNLLGTLSGGVAIIVRTPENQLDLLEVQVFYTANALDELPHQSYVDKITFAITANDTSGKIPSSMVGKTLDITVSSEINQISDPESKVMNALAERYHLTEQELANLKVEIKGVSVGIGTMIDDHAISLSRLQPQASG